MPDLLLPINNNRKRMVSSHKLLFFKKLTIKVHISLQLLQYSSTTQQKFCFGNLPQQERYIPSLKQKQKNNCLIYKYTLPGRADCPDRKYSQ